MEQFVWSMEEEPVCIRYVQICVNGVWGHVCGYGWSSSEARAVCRQLGYSTTGEK